MVNVLHQRYQLPSLLVGAEVGEVLTEVHQTDVELLPALVGSTLLYLRLGEVSVDQSLQVQLNLVQHWVKLK